MDKKLSQDLLTVRPTQLLEFTEISHTYLPASIGEVVASIIFLKGKNNFVTFLCQEWAMLLNCTHRRFDNLGPAVLKVLYLILFSSLDWEFSSFFLKKKCFCKWLIFSTIFQCREKISKISWFNFPVLVRLAFKSNTTTWQECKWTYSHQKPISS